MRILARQQVVENYCRTPDGKQPDFCESMFYRTTRSREKSKDLNRSKKMQYHLFNAILGLVAAFLIGRLPFVSTEKLHGASECDSSAVTPITVLVVGATGATGKHVVQQLLEMGHNVRVVVRSRRRMLDMVDFQPSDHFVVTEASILELGDEDLKQEVEGVDAVVSCLGHNMDFNGIFGQPRSLVSLATSKLTETMKATAKAGRPKKFILMNSDGVAHPAGTDDTRPVLERILLGVLRLLIPPVKDNEKAAKVVHEFQSNGTIEWVVIRPTDLIDGQPTEYVLYDKPVGSLFGGGVTTRATVAKCIVDLILDQVLWEKFKFQMPVLHDSKQN